MNEPIEKRTTGTWQALVLADANLAELVRKGWLTLPTLSAEGAPPSLPVAKLDELLAELRDDRDAR
ncbi:MAG: hypothetical protein KGJ66_04780 [Alphaproteobacteria bacterium]|nr:hypothetical protein [Alphaproteobacteria bacterium]